MPEAHEALLVRVRGLTEPVIADAGMELVDLEYVSGGGAAILRFLIDKPSGVTLDDCVRINKRVADVLDIEDPIPHRYTLEVCSPGMDRPLKTGRDFERVVGKLVKIITAVPVENTTVHTGRVEGCEPGLVILAVNGQPRSIPFDLISRARREVEWR